MVHIPQRCDLLPACGIFAIRPTAIKPTLLRTHGFTVLPVLSWVVITTFARCSSLEPVRVMGDDVVGPKRSPTPSHYAGPSGIHDAPLHQRIHCRTHRR